jgi:Flp pilus assembly CpaF family ATPase
MLSNQTTNADLDDLVLRRLLDRPIQRLLTASVHAALNIVISGESSSTNTMLDALRACVPVQERQERLVARDVRGARVLRLVRAMARGTGALATVRTTSADEALSTLTANTGAATQAAPLTPEAATAGNAVDLIVHLERHRVGELATPVLLCRQCGLATVASFETEPAHSCGRFRHYPLSARLARRLNNSGQPIPAAFREDRFS